jgi:hypothetical protein
MGELSIFNLQHLIDKFNLKLYFETGTGKAVSLRYALRHNFQKFYSVDLDSDLIKEAQNEIKDERLIFINDFSTNAIEKHVPNLDPEKPTLFFLDAHFPGADFHKTTYENSIKEYKEQSLPLELEINLIKEIRNTNKDVIIIDDFKLYEASDKYEDSTDSITQFLDELKINRTPSFIYNSFNKTHNFEKLYNHQGYMVITPK